MTRRRRSRWERIWDAWMRNVRLAFDGRARRRSEGSKRAWATRKRRERAMEPEPVPPVPAEIERTTVGRTP